jgi:hypothetical protein
MRSINTTSFLLSLLLTISLLSVTACGTTDTDDSIPSDIFLSTSSSMTDQGGNRYEVGIRQTDDGWNNPVVTKQDANGELLWSLEHDNSPVDVRAEVVTLDTNQRPWVVFTLDGGSSSNSYITLRATSETAFQSVFQSNYGQGGGPQVSVIARLNPENGVIERATFLTARMDNGNTNRFRVRGIGVADGFVRIQGESGFRPPHAGTSFTPHPEATEFGPCGSFLMQIDLTYSLNEIAESHVLTIQEASGLPNTVWNSDCSIR